MVEPNMKPPSPMKAEIEAVKAAVAAEEKSDA
jgi:HAMP domain-containing protein